MSVTFATVLVGLLLGVHPVGLEVGAGVTRVELLLDGELVGQRSAPPWVIPCDFGEELAPHELIAVARNAAGEEVGRVGQWINFPRSANDRAKVAFDRTDVLLDRTPVALEVGRRGRTLDARTLVDHLVADGRPVSPVEGPAETETRPAEVVVVMDRAAQGSLLEMSGLVGLVLENRGAGRPITQEPIDPLSPSSRPRLRDSVGRGGETAVGALDRRRAHLKTDMRLEDDQVVRFLWPSPEADDGDDEVVRPSRFHYTRGVPPSYGGVLWLLSTVDQPVFAPEEQRLADAVAAAGLRSATTGRRRAVVLILGAAPADASRLSPEAVRGYLERLGVPLHVWAVAPVPDEVARAWGEVRRVPERRALRRAVKELSKDLEHQQIVWLDGLFLPQEVALADPGDDLRLVH